MRNLASFSICLALAAVVQLAAPTLGQAQVTQPAAARPEVGQLPEVYTTENSKMTVTVVRYGPRSSKQALVATTDLDHPWNQRVFRTSVQDVSRRAGKIENTYFIQLEGKHWGLVFNSLNGEGLMVSLREDGDTGKNVRYPLYYSKAMPKTWCRSTCSRPTSSRRPTQKPPPPATMVSPLPSSSGEQPG